MSLLLGQLIGDGMAVFTWYPLPNPADPFFLAIGPLTAVGLWQVGRARLSPVDWRATKVDAAALLVATLAATLAFFLPRQGDASLLQVLVLAAYPFSLMAPTSLALSLLLKLRSRLSWRSLLLPFCTACWMLTWGIWNLQLLTGQTVDGGPVNVAFSVVALCYGVAIYGYRLDPLDDPVWDRRYEGVLRMMPLLFVLMAAVGVLLANSLPNMPTSARISVQLGGVLVVAMAFARQSVLLGERDRLIAAEKLLRQREVELEARVLERTQELVKAREAAEAASQAKSDFLANMSHEIRTPLNGVLGFAQLAMMSSTDPQQQQYMDKIEVAGKQLLRLINDILDMSKIESGKLALEYTRFELPAVLNSVQLQMGDRARAKGLTLTHHIDADAAVPLMGDPLRVEQILVNYVGNAIKFTERGHIDVHASVLQQGERDVLLKVSVQDTGMGMTQSACDRLFEPFEQADNSTTRRFGGSGLGLAICRSLAHLMGGEVGVDSVLHQGSCFWFTARLDKALQPAPSASGLAQAGRHEDGQRTAGKRILLAEDNELNRLLACSILEHQGYTVRVAHDGAEAVECLRQESFDCVLMDMQMPRMDGLTATRLIRAEGLQGHVPIIALTANARAHDEQTCRDAGMDDFVSKPFQVAEMLDTVSRWCHQDRPTDTPN
ncbi:MAG: response regulator [Aquabacterium sp.]|nr:response regulator [Aquabacterium sp.]